MRCIHRNLLLLRTVLVFQCWNRSRSFGNRHFVKIRSIERFVSVVTSRNYANRRAEPSLATTK